MGEPKNCPFCYVELDLIREPDALRRFWRHPDGICCLNGFIVEEYEADLAAWNRRAPWTVTRERALKVQVEKDHLLRDRYGVTLANDEFAEIVAALGGKVEG